MDFIKRNEIFYEINSDSSRIVFDAIIYESDNPMVKNLFHILYDNKIKISIGSDTHSIKYFDYERLLMVNSIINEADLIVL